MAELLRQLGVGAGMQGKAISQRTLTLGYVLALLVIAGLSITSHFALDVAMKSNEGSAAIINQAGRQRMMSQRIASLAAEYRLGDVSAREELRATIGAFETAHDSLTLATRASSLTDDSSRRLQQIYFDPPAPLDRQVRDFVADARRVADMAPGDPAMAPLLTRIFAAARLPLLAGLEQVVSVHQAESERRIIGLEHLQWWILGIVLATLVLEAMMIFRPTIRLIAAYTAELLFLATTDPLTGAANRRSFLERCAAEVARGQRHGTSASLLVFDVDHFKNINDTYGHAAGDEVLKAMGGALKQMLRQSDIWGRIGGEEFAVLLPETSLPEAALVAEKIRVRLAATVVQSGAHAISFTVSIGATSLSGEAGGVDLAMSVADNLMYQAKRTGRNRIAVASMAGEAVAG